MTVRKAPPTRGISLPPEVAIIIIPMRSAMALTVSTIFPLFEIGVCSLLIFLLFRFDWLESKIVRNYRCYIVDFIFFVRFWPVAPFFKLWGWLEVYDGIFFQISFFFL